MSVENQLYEGKNLNPPCTSNIHLYSTFQKGIVLFNSTHRLLECCWPAFVQYRAALCVIDFEAQSEADWSDVISCILDAQSVKEREKQFSFKTISL